jgi:propionyl-CoA carboxylase alpha chain
VVSSAAGRGEAVRRLAAALEGMRVHGLRTNRDELVAALRHPEFLAGPVDTGFLERHHRSLCAPRAGAQAVRLHAAAAALSARVAHLRLSFGDPAAAVEVGCRTDPAGDVVEIAVAGEPLAGLRLGPVTADVVDIEVDGRRRRVHISWTPGGVVDVDSGLGHTQFVALDPLP